MAESTTELPAHSIALSLSPEILSLVFVSLTDAPTSFSRVSKSWRAVSQQEYNLARYILNRYGRRQAIYYAILHLSSRTTTTMLEHLVRAGAHLSVHLWRMLWLRSCHDARPDSRLKLPLAWGIEVPHEVVSALGRLTERELELSPMIADGAPDERGGTAFYTWEEILLQINEVRVNSEPQFPVEDMEGAKELLEQLWQALEDESVK